jgi:GNAT superfamily N-acetyltransferase
MDPDAFQVPKEEGLIEWFESFLDEIPNEDELSLVAEIDGEVAGSLEAKIQQPDDTSSYQLLRDLGETRMVVNALEVDPARWRSGVGTALMKAAERWARGRGAMTSSLDTYAGSPVSVPFYEKLGYVRHSIKFRKHF